MGLEPTFPDSYSDNEFLSVHANYEVRAWYADGVYILEINRLLRLVRNKWRTWDEIEYALSGTAVLQLDDMNLHSREVAKLHKQFQDNRLLVGSLKSYGGRVARWVI